jgi:hypothetical protein
VPSYEPEVIERFAAQLERRARAVRRGVTIGGVVLGGLFGSIPLTPLGRAWPIPHIFGFTTLLVGACAGALIGWVVGEGRAEMYRLHAQTTLCQLHAQRTSLAIWRLLKDRPAEPRVAAAAAEADFEFEFADEPEPVDEPEPEPVLTPAARLAAAPPPLRQPEPVAAPAPPVAPEPVPEPVFSEPVAPPETVFSEPVAAPPEPFRTPQPAFPDPLPLEPLVPVSAPPPAPATPEPAPVPVHAPSPVPVSAQASRPFLRPAAATAPPISPPPLSG